MSKKRDYKAEYQRRIQKGLERGLTRSQARGHPGKGQAPVSSRVSRPRYDKRLEQGLKGIREGKTLRSVAKSIHVAPERLRGYIAQTGVTEKRGGRWVVTDDRREREMQLYTQGRALGIRVPGYDDAVFIGQYMAAVRQFLETNDTGYLEPFEGQYATDTKGNRHVFETRPNTLYRLSTAGGETFEQVYRIVA